MLEEDGMSFLEARLQNRGANNLDFLRFLAASLVMLNHCYPLLGVPTEPLFALTDYMGFGQLGLGIFFFMSGLLITRSWDVGPSAVVFASKRVLRIYPGLLASLLFCVLVVGPLVTTIPLSTYFTRGSTYSFLINLALPAHCLGIPDVFADNPVPVTNGSLWTLPIELGCYAGVLLAGSLRWLNRRVFPWICAAALVAMLWPYAVLGWRGADLTQYILTNSRLCVVYFLLGAGSYVYRRNVPVNRWLALLAAAFFLGTLSTGCWGYWISFLTVPYLILCVAVTPVPWLRRWSKHGDPSYGMYIYAFPIQQCMVYFLGTQVGVGKLFFSTLLLTLAVAYLSWHLLERPAILRKSGAKAA